MPTLADAGHFLKDERIAASVRHWVESMVVGLNLCPFAKREMVKNSVRFVTTEAWTEEALLVALKSELELLESNPSIETTLLIHPNVLQNFYNYNRFLARADDLLVQMKIEGVFQVASFHPDYQFSGTEPEDVENFTNRSPYPMLHLIREESLERAIADFPDTAHIPVRNIALMKSLGREKLQAILLACFNYAE